MHGGRRHGQRARPIDKMGYAAAREQRFIPRVNARHYIIIIIGAPRGGKTTSHRFSTFLDGDDKTLNNDFRAPLPHPFRDLTRIVLMYDTCIII